MRAVPCYLALCLVTACSTPAPDGQPEPDGFEMTPKVGGLDTRTIGFELDLAGMTSKQRRAVAAWFFEAMAQSPWLDLDPITPRPTRLIVRGELRDGTLTLTTSLVDGTGTPAPIALAGVRGASVATLPASIDRLVAETRITLGEPAASVRATSRACTALVSPNLAAAAACTDARRLVEGRRLPVADATLARALGRDPSCALALSLRAGVAMDQGRTRSAVDLARRALALPDRASADARHRARRVLTLATSTNFGDLLKLASAGLEKRPRDPHLRFTQCLGLCLLARYDEALPVLEALRERLPTAPGVLFCLGHARLATGGAEAALALMPEIDARVPALPAARLRAWILFALGKHEELARHLESLRSTPSFRMPDGRIRLLAMRAAHALIQHHDRQAGDLLLAQLDLLRGMPSRLASHGRTIVDAAWVLARLGRARECEHALALLRGQKGLPDGIRADGMVAAALCKIGRTGSVTPLELRYVEEAGMRIWRNRLEAATALRRGKPERGRQLLGVVANATADSTVAFEIAEADTAAGRTQDAHRLLADIARDLMIPRMDKPGTHPLIRPVLAYVFREAQRALRAKSRR